MTYRGKKGQTKHTFRGCDGRADIEHSGGGGRWKIGRRITNQIKFIYKAHLKTTKVDQSAVQ